MYALRALQQSLDLHPRLLFLTTLHVSKVAQKLALFAVDSKCQPGDASAVAAAVRGTGSHASWRSLASSSFLAAAAENLQARQRN